MRKIMLAMGIAFQISNVFALDVVDTPDGPRFVKYRLNGQPIFDDAQKNSILQMSPKDADFIPVIDYPGKEDTDLTSSVLTLSQINADGVRRLLSDKKEIESFIFSYAQSLQKFQSAETATGLDFSTQKSPYILAIGLLKQKYISLP